MNGKLRRKCPTEWNLSTVIYDRRQLIRSPTGSRYQKLIILQLQQFYIKHRLVVQVMIINIDSALRGLNTSDWNYLQVVNREQWMGQMDSRLTLSASTNRPLFKEHFSPNAFSTVPKNFRQQKGHAKIAQWFSLGFPSCSPGTGSNPEHGTELILLFVITLKINEKEMTVKINPEPMS